MDESIAEYDYDNANDVDEFCPDLPNNPDVGNYDEGEGEGGYFPSQSILPTQTQGKCISFGINVLKIQASAIVFCFVFSHFWEPQTMIGTKVNILFHLPQSILYTDTNPGQVLVFCFENCSDLLCDINALVISKFESEEPRICKKN